MEHTGLLSPVPGVCFRHSAEGEPVRRAGTTKRDAAEGVPGSFCRFCAVSRPRLVRDEPRYLKSSGQRRLTVQYEHVVLVTAASRERIILFLEPNKLSFQVANTLLKTAHLGDHARIWTADVAE